MDGEGFKHRVPGEGMFLGFELREGEAQH
jgi:hypothetical protein